MHGPARRSPRQRAAAPAPAGRFAARVRVRVATCDRDGAVRPGASGGHRSRASRTTGRCAALDRCRSAVGEPCRRWLELGLLQAVCRTGTALRRAVDRREPVERRCREDRARGIFRGLQRGEDRGSRTRHAGRARSASGPGTRDRHRPLPRAAAIEWPRMAQAQFARDAVMAERCAGAPRAGVSSCWRATDTCAATSACRVGSARAKKRVFSVGYLETTDDSTPVGGLRCGGANRSGGTRRSLCRIRAEAPVAMKARPSAKSSRRSEAPERSASSARRTSQRRMRTRWGCAPGAMAGS